MKRIINFIVIALCFTMILKSSEILGLDSLNLGNKVKILNLQKSIFTGLIDTTEAYLEFFPDSNTNKNNIMVYYTNLPDRFILNSGDTTFQLFFNTHEYRKFKSNQFDYINEVFVYYNFILKKEGLINRITKFDNSLKIVNETQIISENKQIIFNSKIIYSDSHYALRKIILNTEHFDKMEYFFEDVENGETIDQFTYHYIYLKSDPLPIFKQMEDVYYNEFKSYNEKEIETQKKKRI